MGGRDWTTKLYELTLRALDGSAGDEQLVRLEEILKDNPEAVERYVALMMLHAGLGSSDVLPEAVSDGVSECEGLGPVVSEAKWEDRGHQETIRMRAETMLEDFRERERARQEELFQRRWRSQRRRLLVGAVSMAAILVVAAWAYVSGLKTDGGGPAGRSAPPRPPVVARIARSLNAQWRDTATATRAGTALRPSSMFLAQGLVELAFVGGTQVILQAPVDVRLEDKDRMFLGGGAVSARIGDGAQGFIVRTPNGTVVDYGTEFGVTVDRNGRTEAYVYEGKVGLRGGSDPVRVGESKLLTAGQAGRVDRTGRVQETTFQASRTIREIPKYPGFGIPGRRLSLADVVGGGNGFDTGVRGTALDVLTGQFIPDFYDSSGNGRRWVEDPPGSYPYVLVPDHPYVDGVFVPVSEDNLITVTSHGHRVKLDLQPVHVRFGRGIGHWLPVGGQRGRDPELNGQSYGVPSRPAIMMKRNKGITFDLAAVRRSLPGIVIEGFTALCGISEGDRVPGNKARARFYVLVDGQVRFASSSLTPASGGVPVRIAFHEADRFLTLITAFEEIGAPRNHSVFAVPAFELAPLPEGGAGTEVASMAGGVSPGSAIE